MQYITDEIRKRSGCTTLSFVGEKSSEDFERYKNLGLTSGTAFVSSDNYDDVKFWSYKLKYERTYAPGVEVSNDNDEGGTSYESRLNRINTILFAYEYPSDKLPSFMQMEDLFPLRYDTNTHHLMMTNPSYSTDATPFSHWENLFAKEDDAQVEPLNDFQRKQIEALKVCILTWKPNIENKVAKKEALALSTLIQRNWADAWDKKLTLIDGEYLSLGGLGRIFIVSPTQTAIDELNKQILDEFAQKFYEKYPLEQGKEKGAELFELLSLLYNQKELLLENKISCSTGTMRAEYNKSDREDTSKTNRASIAFVWEFGKKRILLLGDATSEVVIEGIKAYKKKNKIPLETKIYFDAIKVPHHGSDVNLSKELLKHIDSPNWIFCGCTSIAPHLHTLANIIYQPLLDSIQKRILCFNSFYYKNDIYNKMKTKVPVLVKEGIEIEVLQINEITL